MKSPFSAWFLPYLVIGICVGTFVHANFFRDGDVSAKEVHSLRTMGTVRSLNAAGTIAVVLLSDGGDVRAHVLPACMVHAGDRVAVDVIQPFLLAPKTYIVVRAMR